MGVGKSKTEPSSNMDEINITGLVSFLIQFDKVKINSLFFRMQTKYAALVCLWSSLIIVAWYLFDERISCTVDQTQQNVINNYCWAASTYTIPGKVSPAHPGVGQQLPEDNQVFHRLYQWIWIIYLLQGLAFIFPHYLWLILEDGKMTCVKDEFRRLWDKNGEEELVAWDSKMFRFLNSVRGKRYARLYHMCEGLSILNIVVQCVLLDYMAGFAFWNNGWEIFRYSINTPNPYDRTDQLAQVFPLVTKCTFKAYGPAGGIQPFDSICILPVNNVIEKIYLVIWSGLLFLLAGILLIQLPLRISLFLVKPWRYRYIRVHISQKSIPTKDLHGIRKTIIHKLPYSSWYFMVQMARNMDKDSFTRVLRILHLKKTEEYKEQRDFYGHISDTITYKLMGTADDESATETYGPSGIIIKRAKPRGRIVDPENPDSNECAGPPRPPKGPKSKSHYELIGVNEFGEPSRMSEGPNQQRRDVNIEAKSLLHFDERRNEASRFPNTGNEDFELRGIGFR